MEVGALATVALLVVTAGWLPVWRFPGVNPHPNDRVEPMLSTVPGSTTS